MKTRVSLRYDELMLVGYARVSTHEQNLTFQTGALKQAGCQKIFDDRVSGASSEWPGLKAALEYVREGDTLLVWRLDRLGRSLMDLVEIIGCLEKRGVGFRSPSTSPPSRKYTIKEIYRILGMSKPALYTYLRRSADRKSPAWRKKLVD